MNNILITCGGRRVSLLKSFKKELKSIYPEGLVFISDSYPTMAPVSYVADGYFCVSSINNPDYIDNLLKICLENDIGLIIPTYDGELITFSLHEKEFKEHGISLVISSHEFVTKTVKKSKTHPFFKSLKINFPLEYTKNDYKLPVYIKPDSGSGSIKNFIIREECDFLKEHFINGDYLFLEYLDHNEFEEFTCDLYYSKENILKCAVPRKRIEVRSGEVTKGLTEKNSVLDFIYKHFHFIEGARGCITLQLFKHKLKHNIVCIEINARFGGGYPLSYHAGANYPLWIIKEYLLGEEIDFFEDWKENTLMLRYDEEIIVENFQA